MDSGVAEMKRKVKLEEAVSRMQKMREAAKKAAQEEKERQEKERREAQE
jgi:ribosomal protein S6